MPQTPVDNPEGTPGLFRFSTHALPAHERVPVFCEVLGRKLLRVQAEPLPRFEFNAEMQIRSLPGLTFVAERHSPFRIGRTKELLSDSDDSIVVQSFSTGAVERQFGHEVALSPGDAVACSSGEVGDITVPGPCTGFALVIRRERLAPLLRDADRCFARPVPAGSQVLRLLKIYLSWLNDNPVPLDPEFDRVISSQICDLVALALGAARDASEVAKNRGLRSARLRAIKKYLALDPARDHTIGAVAARFRLSPRYVQMLFQDDGVTFTEYLRDHALEAGFGDLSYFNRMFRRRYGLTPGESRERAGRS